MVEGQEPSGEENVYYLHYNHSELVKFSNRADYAYRTTCLVLRLMMRTIEGYRRYYRDNTASEGSRNSVSMDFRKDMEKELGDTLSYNGPPDVLWSRSRLVNKVS